MASCIKCGREIPDGELFCNACALNPEQPEPVRPAQPAPQGRMQKPVPVRASAQTPPGERKPAQPVKAKLPRALTALLLRDGLFAFRRFRLFRCFRLRRFRLGRRLGRGRLRRVLRRGQRRVLGVFRFLRRLAGGAERLPVVDGRAALFTKLHKL